MRGPPFLHLGMILSENRYPLFRIMPWQWAIRAAPICRRSEFGLASSTWRTSSDVLLDHYPLWPMPRPVLGVDRDAEARWGLVLHIGIAGWARMRSWPLPHARGPFGDRRAPRKPNGYHRNAGTSSDHRVIWKSHEAR